jgi:hypothetical protein
VRKTTFPSMVFLFIVDYLCRLLCRKLSIEIEP